MLIHTNRELSNIPESPSEILEELKTSYKNFHKTDIPTLKRLPTDLYIDGLDNEQIWQQIELTNREFLPSLSFINNSSLFTAKSTEPQPVDEKESDSVEEVIRRHKTDKDSFEEDQIELDLSDGDLTDEENSEENDEQADFEDFEKEVALSSEDEDMLYDSHVGDLEDESELTSFQKQQKKMAEKIDELEEKALQPKKWQMTGEVTSSSRPKDSLIEDNLNFDHSTVPAPPVTLESNKSLEEIIVERIKNKTYDDVERKVKQVEKPSEYRKEAMVDQEKSKKSLAEIYEESRANSSNLAKVEADKRLQKLHSEIRSSLNSLFSKLNSFSSFHYSPASTQPDAVIVNNMAALYSEEKVPTAQSAQAGALAPEEITDKRKSGLILGKDERSETDKKRERRKKKILQRHRLKKPGKVETGKREKSLIEKGTDKSLRSSTAMFDTLENNKNIEAVKRSNLNGKNSKSINQSMSKKLKL